MNNFSDGHPWLVTYNEGVAKAVEGMSLRVMKCAEKEMNDLSQAIEDFYWDNLQSPEEFIDKLKFAREIQGIMEKPVGDVPGWTGGTLVLSGSSITGIAAKNSDVDLCYWHSAAFISAPSDNEESLYSQMESADFKVAQKNMLEIIQARLQHDLSFSKRIVKMELIPASIPIISMQVRMGDRIIHADLAASCNVVGFVSGLHNSFLLRHYNLIDERVGPLCFFVKQWAEKQRVKGPTTGKMNSYCIVLLVIHFLQCGVEPPVLPNLRKLYTKEKISEATRHVVDEDFFAIGEKKGEFRQFVEFADELPYPLPELPKKNTLSLAELFFRFLCYYKLFDFNGDQIDLKNGCVARKQEQKTVHVIDPIDKHNPARTVNREGLEYIQSRFGFWMNIFGKLAERSNGDVGFPSIDWLLADI